MLFRSRRSRREGERGQILVMFTLVIVLLMALTALVIDVSLLRNDGARLQNALDSGALAASQGLPANSANIAGVRATAVDYTQRNFPGVSAPATSFACLVGVDNNGLPRVADMPGVCRVSFAANSSQWRCTDVVCWAPCDPTAVNTDICNTIILANNVTRPYTFGRAIGVDSGNTGTLVSAACNGACGGSLTAPVDVVLLLDRTGSMDQSRSIRNLRDGGDSVLQAFNPTVQRVALGFTGPSSETNTTDGYYGTDATSAAVNNCTNPHVVHALALDPDPQPGPAPAFAGAGTAADNGATPPNNNNQVVLPKPAGTASGNFLLATIVVDGGSSTTITPPGGWTLIRRTNDGTNLNGTNVGIATYRRFAGGAEPATYTFGLTGTRRAVGAIVRYTGVDTGTPVIDNDGDSSNAASVSLVAPAISAGGNSAAVVAAYGSDSNTTFPPALPNPPGPGMPNGFTERVDAANPSVVVGSSGPTVGVGTATGTGNIGAKTAKTVASARWVAQLIALRGADVPGETYGTDVNADMAQWVPIGFSGTDADSPPVTYSENFVDNADPPNVIHTSHVAQAIDCFDVSQVGTNLARPLYMATKYLADHGRPNIKRGIILETDGAPENGGNGPSSDYTNAGVLAAATAAKNAGIEVFTVGYGNVDRNLLASMATTTMPSDDPGYRTTTCDNRENTDGDHFFCLPLAGDLSAVLHQAALQLTGGSRLVQLYPRPLVTSVSPSTGSKAGGTVVTITGKYFTEAYSVTFGGTQGSNLTVVSDTSIRVTSPAGAANAIVDIQVSTPGGTSAQVGGDRYTYGP